MVPSTIHHRPGLSAARRAGATVAAIVLTGLSIALSHGCCRSDAPAPRPRDAATDTLAITAVSIDWAEAPRSPEPLVAGETARIDIEVQGGEGPYQITVRSPLVTTAPTEAASPGATGATLAVAAPLPVDAETAVHELTVTVRDRHGARAARTAELHVVGGGETPAPGARSGLMVVDHRGRRRPRYVRGERLRARGALDGIEGELALSVTAFPNGAALPVARRPLPVATDGSFELTFAVPPLAPTGRYRLAVTAGARERAATDLVIHGQPFEPATRLTIDELVLRGGPDRRSPRAGILGRGEVVGVRARVAGMDGPVASVLRLRDQRGALIDETSFGEAEPALLGPRARIFVGGTWTVPGTLRPGRYGLELEVSVGDDVSQRVRDVWIE